MAIHEAVQIQVYDSKDEKARLVVSYPYNFQIQRALRQINPLLSETSARNSYNGLLDSTGLVLAMGPENIIAGYIAHKRVKVDGNSEYIITFGDVVPEYRNEGVYTKMVTATEAYIRKLGTPSRITIVLDFGSPYAETYRAHGFSRLEHDGIEVEIWQLSLR